MLPCLLALACSHPPASSESESPTLVFRCHDGRVSAYVVVATTADIAAGDLPEDAVEVQLDSAPTCSESTP